MENENKIIGIGLLVLGISLMLVTFFFAVNTLINPGFIKGFSELIPVSGSSGIGNIVHAIIYFVPAIILFVMGGIGGRILKHGIVLIRSSKKRTSVRRKKTLEQRENEMSEREQKKQF